MKRERFYYEEHRNEIKDIEREMEAAKESMAQTGRAIGPDEAAQETDALIAKAESRLAELKNHVSKERMECFQELSEQAMELAEAAFLNVVTDVLHGCMGMIQLSGIILLFNEHTDPRMKEIFSNLVLAADETMVTATQENLVQLVFFYHLGEVPA